MVWSFETEPEFQSKLDWVDEFVRSEVEPLDLVLGNPYDKGDARSMAVARPLRERVKAEKLWACHLDPELGGEGYGQVKLALLKYVPIRPPSREGSPWNSTRCSSASMKEPGQTVGVRRRLPFRMADTAGADGTAE